MAKNPNSQELESDGGRVKQLTEKEMRPAGIVSGMTKRLAVSDGSFCPAGDLKDLDPPKRR